MMRLEFEKTKMFLANVNVRAEVHGETREPAGDLKLEVDLPNDVLSEIHPALKSLLYYFDEARPEDLVDKGKRGEAGYLPHLRFPALGVPLKWDEEMTGAKLTIHSSEKSRLVLLDVKVNNVSFEPKDHGIVTLTLRVQAHPDERAFGTLCTLSQSEVEISLEAEGER